MAADAVLRRIHRIGAVLFLLSIPPAWYFSATGDPASPSPVVYVPLFPLFILTLTGTYQLVRPWVRRRRGQRMTQGTEAGEA
jgi:hypothetical protein